MKNLKLADVINIILTFMLVMVAFKQFDLSNQLGDIDKSAYNEKLLNSKKEIRIVTRNIMSLFSYKGIDERLEHNLEENIALAREFNGFLEEGSANYLLAQDSESLKHWFKAIGQLQLYDNFTPSKMNTVIIAADGLESAPSDSELNKNIVGDLGRAWREVMEVYQRLGLSMYQSLKDLEEKGGSSILSN
ncbi:MAG: hypothetical protein ISS45_09775 [Candidatus Omnitrophica bacterium]|nr:hypothetical protein [Candidatus Omnitrophota bacterium]